VVVALGDGARTDVRQQAVDQIEVDGLGQVVVEARLA